MISSKSPKVCLGALSILFALLILFMGCASIVGLGVGLAVESDKNSNPPDISLASIKGFEPGTTIILKERDFPEIKCQYLGFSRRGDYDSVLTMPQTVSDSVAFLMPFFGETITVRDTLGATATYLFLGFHYHFVDNKWVPRMAVGFYPDSIADNINIYSINNIKIDDNRTISRTQILEYMGGPGFPQNCALFIRINSGARGIPINAVDNVQMPSPPGNRPYWLTGLIVGFCIDAILIGALIYDLHEHPPDL